MHYICICNEYPYACICIFILDMYTYIKNHSKTCNNYQLCNTTSSGTYKQVKVN